MKKLLSPFVALQFRAYRLYWFGSLAVSIATQMITVAIGWQVYSLTHSAFYLGLVGLAGFLPMFGFSLIGGLTADRVNRKNILYATFIIIGFVACLLSIATFLNGINPYLIYCLYAINGAVLAFNIPARQAILPHLVPKKYFMNAVSLNGLLFQSSVLIGPSLAGTIIALYGVGSVYVIATTLYLIMVLLLLFLPYNQPATKAGSGGFSLDDIREGLGFVKNTPILIATMLLDFLATFFASATSLMPIFASDILKVGPQGLGLLYSAPAAGGILAGLGVAAARNLNYPGRVILISVVIFGLGTIGFGLSTAFLLSLFFLFLIGAADMVSAVLRNTIRQLITPNYLRGRMVSINMLFIRGGPQLGDAEAGLVAALIGAPASVVIGGIATVAMVGLVTYLFPQLRSYKSEEMQI